MKNIARLLEHNLQGDEEVPFIRWLSVVAIGLICWFHLWLYSWKSSNFTFLGKYINLDLLPRTGFIGVDILFFCLGFLLFYPYARHWFSTGKIPRLRQFYVYNGLKYLPAYYAALLIITFFFNLDNFQAVRDYLSHLTSHLLFVHPFNYNHFGSLNAVLWIYGILGQLLLIFPLLAYCFRKQPLITLCAGLGISFAFRFIVQGWQLSDHEFYVWLCQVPGLLDLIILGMLGACLHCYVKEKKIYFKNGPLFFTIQSLLLFVLFFYLLQWLSFSFEVAGGSLFWRARYRDLLGLLLLGLTFTSSRGFKYYRKIFDNSLSHFLYLISFNFLIWHQAVCLLLYKFNLPWARPQNFGEDSHWQFWYLFLSIGISLGIAVIMSFVLERPLAALGKKLSGYPAKERIGSGSLQGEE